MLKQTIFLLFVLVYSASVDAGVFGVRAHFESHENFNDLVGIRYKLRMDENVFEDTAKIIFNGSHLYNPDYHLTGYSPAVETNFYNYLAKLSDDYVDMGCATSGGMGDQPVPSP
jgi:hypothetical protein